MDIKEAQEKVRQLLELGLSTKQLLILAANFRRLELEYNLTQRTGNLIIDGPFKGIKHTGTSCNSLLLPKILGTYEKEIINDLLDLCINKKCFIDIGCADGYYTTGIAASTNIPCVIGVDINKTALDVAKKSAHLNKVENKCKFMSDINQLPEMIDGKTLIMIDVDGNEIDVIERLIQPLTDKQKQGLDILIETDRDSEDNDNTLKIICELEAQGFCITKVIEQSIECRFASITDEITNSYLDKTIYGLEGRPTNQKWLITKYIKGA